MHHFYAVTRVLILTDSPSQEALLVFYLQLFGDPAAMRLPTGTATSVLNSANLMEKVSECPP